jgi:hypothetical protein
MFSSPVDLLAALLPLCFSCNLLPSALFLLDCTMYLYFLTKLDPTFSLLARPWIRTFEPILHGRRGEMVEIREWPDTISGGGKLGSSN